MSNSISNIAVLTLISACFMISVNTAEAEKVNPVSSSEKETVSNYVAYYFHGNFRCTNCRKIEQFSREAVEKYFAEELKTKRLVFQEVNIDVPENKHFINDYQLYTRSLIIAEFREGKQVKWKNLTRVWNYLGNREKFYDYVRSEIQAYLESS